jgi:hypothetical protein
VINFISGKIFISCYVYLTFMKHDTRYHERNMQTHDEIRELGHEAIKGVVTVGSVNAAAGLMGGMLGAFPK